MIIDPCASFFYTFQMKCLISHGYRLFKCYFKCSGQCFQITPSFQMKKSTRFSNKKGAYRNKSVSPPYMCIHFFFNYPHPLELMYSRRKFMSLPIRQHYFCHRVHRNNKLERNLITFVFPSALNCSNRRIIHCLCMR